VNHANPVHGPKLAVAGMYLEGASDTRLHTNKEKLRGHQPPQFITTGLGEGLHDVTKMATWELEMSTMEKKSTVVLLS